MKNLNRRQIANHLHTSVNETSPFGNPLRQSHRAVADNARSGEFPSRQHDSPEDHLCTDRNFTQSLWGRR